MVKKTSAALELFLEKEKDAKKKKMSSFIEPMLATLTHTYFYKLDWMYERKFDGERCLVFKNGDKVMLKSRNDKLLNVSYPEIKEAIEKLTDVPSMILDGEVVAFKRRVTSFERLQPRMHVTDENKIGSSKIRVYYYIFDIPYVNGYDITQLPLIKRKHILKNLFYFKDPLRFTLYKFQTSSAYFKGACKKGWEGLVVKDKNSRYVHKRSPSWLKFKCVANQELVIGGYTDPQHSRVGFGALLLGYYKNGKLHYAGKVGTGFDTQTLIDLKKKFDAFALKKCPFVNYEDSLKGIHWLKPRLVAEIGFEEWTKDNKLRQPRYLGLRLDKAAQKVVQEK